MPVKMSLIYSWEARGFAQNQLSQICCSHLLQPFRVLKALRRDFGYSISTRQTTTKIIIFVVWKQTRVGFTDLFDLIKISFFLLACHSLRDIFFKSLTLRQIWRAHRSDCRTGKYKTQQKKSTEVKPSVLSHSHNASPGRISNDLAGKYIVGRGRVEATSSYAYFDCIKIKRE